MVELPLGYRHNNPLNIRRGSNWRGLATHSDVHAAGLQWTQGYCQFRHPMWGIRAAARLLYVYQNRHGIRTIPAIINRWAPHGDSNPVEAYVDFVTNETGFRPAQRLNLDTYQHVLPLIKAMAYFENGMRWIYQPQTTLAGLELADVVGVPTIFPT